jgi:hypothetical protein
MNKPNPEIINLFNRLRRKRLKSIKSIMAGRKPKGDPKMERFEAAIIHDSEFAPFSTNGEMLKMIGVDPCCRHHHLDDEAVRRRIVELTVGLSMWHIYLSNTDHLNDRELLDIIGKMMKDTVRIVPPVREMAEVVDLNPQGVQDTVAHRDMILPKPRKRLSQVDKMVACR